QIGNALEAECYWETSSAAGMCLFPISITSFGRFHRTWLRTPALHDIRSLRSVLGFKSLGAGASQESAFGASRNGRRGSYWMDKNGRSFWRQTKSFKLSVAALPGLVMQLTLDPLRS